MKFAHVARGIARRREHLRHGEFIRRCLRAWRRGGKTRVEHGGAKRIATSHDRRTRRRTHGHAPHIGEAHSSGTQRIDDWSVGKVHACGVEFRQLIHTDIVKHDEEDVWFRGFRGGLCGLGSFCRGLKVGFACILRTSLDRSARAFVHAHGLSRCRCCIRLRVWRRFCVHGGYEHACHKNCRAERTTSGSEFHSLFVGLESACGIYGKAVHVRAAALSSDITSALLS